MAPITIEPLVPSAALVTLLSACDLPVADISPSGPARFFGVVAEDELIGAIGLEPYGEVALLRSLAVKPDYRSHGMGLALLAYAEQYAASHGIHAVYLLTTTAAPFFLAHGYHKAERATAPAAIQSTAQFSGLCPSVASFLRKRLD